MDKYDRILRQILRNTSRIRPSVKRSHEFGDCLSEEVLTAYAEGKLDAADRERTEHHLVACRTCRHAIKALIEVRVDVEKEQIMQAPATLTNRAKNLVGRRSLPSAIEIVLEFVRDAVRVISTTANALSAMEPSAVPARDGQRVSPQNGVRASHQFDSFHLDMMVEHNQDGTWNIEAQLSDVVTRSAVDDVRINLMRGSRALASYPPRRGFVVFKSQPRGVYELEVVRGKNTVGTVMLKLDVVE